MTNIYTITAVLLCMILIPIIAGTMAMMRREVTRSSRDERWLLRHR